MAWFDLDSIRKFGMTNRTIVCNLIEMEPTMRSCAYHPYFQLNLI